MKSGRLKDRIIIQALIMTKNAYGEPNEHWVEFKSVWAEVTPLVGRKYYDALQNNSEITTEIRIRYIKDISTKMRILEGDEIYDIKSIINIKNANKEMTLMCKANL